MCVSPKKLETFVRNGEINKVFPSSRLRVWSNNNLPNQNLVMFSEINVLFVKTFNFIFLIQPVFPSINKSMLKLQIFASGTNMYV